MNSIMKKAVAVVTAMALTLTGVMTGTPGAAAKTKAKARLKKKSVTLTVGQKKTIKLKKPKSAKKAKYTFKSRNKKIAKVTKKGKVTGISAGNTKIVVKEKLKKKTATVGKVKIKVKPKNSGAKTSSAPAGGNPGGGSQSGGKTPSAASYPRASRIPHVTYVPTPSKAPQEPKPTGSYRYFMDYTLGWSDADQKLVAYKDGRQLDLAEAGVPIFNKKSDNVFAQQLNNVENLLLHEPLTLTAPVQYTGPDGSVYNVDSMISSYSFMADPTCIDNTDIDGKLYVYGATESFSYDKDNNLEANKYENHSLSIFSTTDMVNWTDEETLDNENLTNLPSVEVCKASCGWAKKAWAPSALRIDGDDDGRDEYYIFYSNGDAIGYVQGVSPTGPWTDDLGKPLFDRSTPNCSDVEWCTDPAVLTDKKGGVYVYFGASNPKTARICKIRFQLDTGKVLLDGTPQTLDTYYHGGSGVTFTKGGIYHNFSGTIPDNLSNLYGERCNNRPHMQEFKGHQYIFYSSTILANSLLHTNKQYRNLHVDEIDADDKTDEIFIQSTYEGASQIETFYPYKKANGGTNFINATTCANSAGVRSKRENIMVGKNNSLNGSPMVLDEIHTGDWVQIRGVDFGKKGLNSFGAEYKSKNGGLIELFIDDPTNSANMIGSVLLHDSTDQFYSFVSAPTAKTVTGVHDIFFVFCGSGYKVASWYFSEGSDGCSLPDTSYRIIYEDDDDENPAASSN